MPRRSATRKSPRGRVCAAFAGFPLVLVVLALGVSAPTFGNTEEPVAEADGPVGAPSNVRRTTITPFSVKVRGFFFVV